MELVVFYLFAALAVGTALAVVFLQRAVYGALCLIVCFGAIAGLFIQLEAHFLGAIQIIVYAGAIMVLFLFVIMLLDPQKEVFMGRKPTLVIYASPLVLFLGYIVLRALANAPQPPQGSLSEQGAINQVAHALFRDYLLPFELTSILILVAVLGSIVLTKRPPAETE
ncbi:MAG: NADH-quinone oxidoreductase subunit J [Acidobacteriota bacterium]